MQKSNESRYPYPMRVCVRFGALAAGAFLFCGATWAQTPGSARNGRAMCAAAHTAMTDEPRLQCPVKRPQFLDCLGDGLLPLTPRERNYETRALINRRGVEKVTEWHPGLR